VNSVRPTCTTPVTNNNLVPSAYKLPKRSEINLHHRADPEKKHSSIGMISPVDYELAQTRPQAA
jgi:hypothetical protein